MSESMRHKNKNAQTAHVEWIGADPDFTGKGIGSKLMEHGHAYCAGQNGCTAITLEVVGKNTGAIRLYERKGYVIQPGGDCVDKCCTG